MKEQFIMAALFLASCTPVTAEKSPIPEESLEAPTQPAWIHLENTDLLARDQWQSVIDGAIRWDNLFGCGREITVSVAEGEIMIISPGQVGAMANFSPGIIRLSSLGETSDAILAGMTIACMSDKRTMLDESITIPQGKIIGYSGLSIIILTNEGNEAQFPYFMIGMSERNALIFPEYTPNDPRSGLIGRLTLEAIPSTNQANQLVQEWVKNSDVPSFVRAVLKMPPSIEVSPTEIYLAMVAYQRAWNSASRQ